MRSFRIDIAELRTGEGKRYLFVAVDRTSKLAFARLHAAANVHTATDFLRMLVSAVPYKIHTVPTDNGLQFCPAPRFRDGPTARFSRHVSMTILASAQERNHSRLRHSSRNLPLKLSVAPFCQGSLGSINAVSMSWSTIHFSNGRDEVRVRLRPRR